MFPLAKCLWLSPYPKTYAIRYRMQKALRGGKREEKNSAEPLIVVSRRRHTRNGVRISTVGDGEQGF